MKITSKTKVVDVAPKYMRSWVKINLKNGKNEIVYTVDVDPEFETAFSVENAIIYNKEGATDYADDGIPFSQIDSIELADPPEAKKHG